MTDRDRLVELLSINLYGNLCDHCGADNDFEKYKLLDMTADYLIANDVRIERHGKWEYIGTDKHGNVFRCSYCALRIGLDYETTYCPHCGAKMDLEEEK